MINKVIKASQENDKTVNSTLFYILIFTLFFLFSYGCSDITSNQKDNGLEHSILDVTKVFSSVKGLAGEYSVQEFLNESLQKSMSSPPVKYGLGDKKYTYWYTADITDELSNNEFSYLEVPYSILYQFDIWFVDNNKNILSHYRAGPGYNKSERYSESNHLLFPLPLGSKNGLKVIISTKTASSVVFSAILWQDKALEINQGFWDTWQLVLFGATAVLVLFNLFLSAALRDPSHLYYVLYLVCLTIVNATIAGTIDLNSIRETTGNQLLQYIIAITILFDAIFINSFLNTRKIYFKTWRVSIIVMSLFYIPLTFAAFGFFNDVFVDRYLVTFVTILSNVGLLYYFGISIVAYRHGVKQARFVILAFSVFFISYGIFRLYTFQFFDYHPVIKHMLEIGSLLEGLLLSLALADRINLLTIDKEKMEKKALNLVQDYSRHFIHAQEEEREAFSQRLHYSIIDNLSNLKKNIDTIINKCESNTLVDKSKTEIAEQIYYCQNLLQNVRTMSHDLHPHLLKRLGLKQAIESTLESRLNKQGIEWQSAIDDLSNLLDEERQITIFRVVQACLNYLLTNSNSQEIILSIRENGHSVIVDIKDDASLVTDESEFNHGRDISNIRRRVGLFKGTFSIVTEPEGDRHLSFTIPF